MTCQDITATITKANPINVTLSKRNPITVNLGTTRVIQYNTINWDAIVGDQEYINLSGFTDDMGIASHIADLTNPHEVTQTQVGLSDVNNTSDLNKPISTATQTALNLLVPYSGATSDVSLGDRKLTVNKIDITANGSVYSDYNIKIGDDSCILDIDTANMIGIKGLQDQLSGGIIFGTGKDTNIYRGGVNQLKTDDDFVAAGAITGSNLSGTNTGDQVGDGSTITGAGTISDPFVATLPTDTNDKVKYDSEDPTAGYLSSKVIAGDGIIVSEGTGTDENKLVVTNTDKGSDVDLSGYFNKSEALVVVKHKDGTITQYKQILDTDVSRGSVLLTAVSSAVNGDIYYLSQATFDIGVGVIDCQISAGNTFSLIGSGKYKTIIKSSANAFSPAKCVISVASNSEVSNLAIYPTGDANFFPLLLGWKGSGRTIENSIIKDIHFYYGTGTYDCLYFIDQTGNADVTMKNITSEYSAWDVIACQMEGTFNIYDSDFICELSASNIMKGTWNYYDTIFNITGTNGGMWLTTTEGIKTSGVGNANIFSGKLTMNALDTGRKSLINTGTGYLSVNSSFVFETDKTSGTITKMNTDEMKYVLGEANTISDGYLSNTDWNTFNNKLSSETDPVFTSSQASNITETDITNLSNLSGENTGDQDLSGYMKLDQTNPQTTIGTFNLVLKNHTIVIDGDLRGLFAVSHTKKIPFKDNGSGITITSIIVQCSSDDPTTELDANIMYCDAQGTGAFPGANPTLVRAIDTASGNYSSGAITDSISTGKELYLLLDNNPTDVNTMWTIKIEYTIS